MLDPSQAFAEAVALHRKGDLAAAESAYLRLLKLQSDHFDTLHLLGLLRCQQGQFVEAVSLIDAALRINPHFPPALVNHGRALEAVGRRAEALASFDKALAIQPGNIEALLYRGTLLRGMGLLVEALASFDRVLAVQPDHAEVLYRRGLALRDLRRPAEALASFDRALTLKPSYPEALNNRGLALLDLQRPADALASFERAAAIRPDYAVAFNNRGNVLLELKRPAEALVSYEAALAIQPRYGQALYNRGVALQELRRPLEALASYDQALSVDPNHLDALNNRGVILRSLKHFAPALASYDRALAIKPDYIEALNNRGRLLRDLKRPEEALSSHDKALATKPDDADSLCNRGIALRDLKRYADALASFEPALAVNPSHRYAFAGMADAALAVCDWGRTGAIYDELERRIPREPSIITPFTLLGYSGDPALQLTCAKAWLADEFPVPEPPLWHGEIRSHEKLRIAYLSADFRRHPVASLIAGLFEGHDRARFEVFGISFGPDDHSDMRARLIRAFDQFYDVRAQSDLEVASLLHEMRIDIAVDLSGRTEDSRLGILVHRPAPVQVTYLGYPGTTGADFIDYVIADKIVVPFDEQRFFSEAIVYLPDSYQVNDSRRKIDDRTPSRSEVGLPDGAFVFCCFNNNYKITASLFDIWMRLLHRVEGGVLWLLQDNMTARENLCAAAAARGVDPARLVFAGRMEPEQHLARHRLADLFLDTLPYNAHTTASDALWAGLPVLTCAGSSFAGRVATSLLHAAGLPDLATRDLDEYEGLALRLASEASLLGGFRRRLADNRPTCPLFDTDRFRRHIESAYATMWETAKRGLKPQGFSVSSEAGSFA